MTKATAISKTEAFGVKTAERGSAAKTDGPLNFLLASSSVLGLVLGVGGLMFAAAKLCGIVSGSLQWLGTSMLVVSLLSFIVAAHVFDKKDQLKKQRRIALRGNQGLSDDRDIAAGS